MFETVKRVTVALLALGLGACVTRGEIEELKSNQEKILAKLETMGRAAPERPQPQRPQGPDPAKVYSMPIEGSAMKGPADAWITLVEVSEFQCPFCKRVVPTIKEIEKKYGNDIRFVFKNNPLPFHNRAQPASLAGMCANEQGKFWEMHDLMFENQNALEDTNLENYAKQAGVDMKKWQACYTAKKYADAISAEQAQASKFGARGTPAFFINGRFLSGAQPVESFVAIIDEELKKAKAANIPRKDYYNKAVMEQGVKSL